ncbi:MAG: TetR/AcrR family transcriptional regulator [Litorilinea sp.]
MSSDSLSNSRTRILDAAKPLFVARGYTALSMRELGAAVGVSKAAIYYHFRDKEALFCALVEQSIAQLETLILAAQRAGPDARRVVRQIVHDILALPMEERAMIRVAMQEMGHMSEDARREFLAQYNTRFLGQLHRVFAQGMEADHFRTLVPETATWTLLGMMYPHFYATGHAPMRATGDEQIDAMLTIFFDGICLPPAATDVASEFTDF